MELLIRETSVSKIQGKPLPRIRSGIVRIWFTTSTMPDYRTVIVEPI